MQTPPNPVLINSSIKFLKDNIEQVLLDKEHPKRVQELGQDIDLYFEGKEIIIITLLDGAIIFTADLIRNMNIPLRLDCLRVSSCGNSIQSRNSSGES